MKFIVRLTGFDIMQASLVGVKVMFMRVIRDKIYPLIM